MIESRRDRQRRATLDEIKAVARQQMAQEGTGSLSLRAIAAAMGMTAPALYRYYANRDDLITALIVNAYNDLADTIEAARASQPADDYTAQLRTALHAYRQWALDHRVDFELIFGNPIAGYHAPAEQTRPAASRNMAVFVDILDRAHAAGKLHPPAHYQAHPLEAQLRQRHPNTAAAYLAMHGWARIHGMIMLELFEHSTPVVQDTAAFYRHEVEALILESGLTR